MKNINYTKTLLLLTGLFLFACKKESIPTFDTEASVYFTATAPLNPYQRKDSIGVGFGYSPVTVTDSTVRVSVSVLGRPATEDRPYKIVIDPMSTARAGVNYDLPANPVIRAGLSVDSLNVTFHRTPDLLNGVVTLYLHLEANEYFKTDLRLDTLDPITGKSAGYLTFKLSAVDGLRQPSNWNSFAVYYFGRWTEKKLRLMSTVTGMPLDGLNDYDPRWDYWGTMMNRYLIDQAAAGNTILEDDGTPMTLGRIITG